IPRTLAQHWDGTAWTVIPTPNQNANSNVLTSLVARTATDIWAVGQYDGSPSAGMQTLVLHWNGVQWSIISSPNTAAHDNYLTGVSASGANDAWAVGWNNNGGLNRDPVIEHWNGVSWSIVANPSLPGVRRQLYSVAARAANDVWATGDLYAG